MQASSQELELSQVSCLLDELDGQPLDRSSWQGYHPRVYCRGLSKQEADGLVATLCARLQNLDVRNYSLEMQTWWRDHQQADKERLEREFAANTEDADRQAALEKLTPYERHLLGL